MASVMVKNLPKKTTEDFVRNIFGKKGLLTDVKLKYTSDGTLEFAFLVYQSEKEAQNAIKDLNKTSIQSNTIAVEACINLGNPKRSKSKSPNPPPSKERNVNPPQSLSKKSLPSQSNSTIQSHHSKQSQQSLQVPTARGRSKSASSDDFRCTSTAYSKSSATLHNFTNNKQSPNISSSRRNSTSPCDSCFSSSHTSTSSLSKKSHSTNQTVLSKQSQQSLQVPIVRGRSKSSSCDDVRCTSTPYPKSSTIVHSFTNNGQSRIDSRFSSSCVSTSKERDVNLAQSLSKKSLPSQSHSTIQAHSSKHSQQSLQVPTLRGKSKSSSYDDVRFTSTPYPKSSETLHNSRNNEQSLQVPSSRRNSTSPCGDSRFSLSCVSNSKERDVSLAQSLSRKSLPSQSNSTIQVYSSKNSQQSLQVPTLRGKSKSSSYDDVRFTSTPYPKSSETLHSSKNNEQSLYLPSSRRNSTSPILSSQQSLQVSSKSKSDIFVTLPPFSQSSFIPLGLSSTDNDRTPISTSPRNSITALSKSTLPVDQSNFKDSGISTMSSKYLCSPYVLPEGVMPIKASKVEIVWGCVKVKRSQSQSFQIENQLSVNINIEVLAAGSNFKLVTEGNSSQILTALTVSLRAYETKTLSVIFQPSKIGPLSDKLVFYPRYNYDDKHLRQSIRVSGYGGYVSLELSKTFKDCDCNYWFSMGVFEQKATIVNFVSIKNTGALSAFAIIELEDTGFMSKSMNVSIFPNEVILKPQEEKRVKLTYTPDSEDFESKNEAIYIGSLKLVSGAEADRGRIRKLCSIAWQNNETVDGTAKRLSKFILGEDIPTDLDKLNEESSTSISALLKSITVRQIHLSVEKNPNLTLEMPANLIDNSTIFKTLYQDSLAIQDENNSDILFTIHPYHIMFSIPNKTSDLIYIHSKCKTTEKFKVTVIGDFKVSPSNGDICCDQYVPLRVTCNPNPNEIGRLLIVIKTALLEVKINVAI